MNIVIYEILKGEFIGNILEVYPDNKDSYSKALRKASEYESQGKYVMISRCNISVDDEEILYKSYQSKH